VRASASAARLCRRLRPVAGSPTSSMALCRA
jgi:hypothetical protein